MTNPSCPICLEELISDSSGFHCIKKNENGFQEYFCDSIGEVCNYIDYRVEYYYKDKTTRILLYNENERAYVSFFTTDGKFLSIKEINKLLKLSGFI